MQKKNCWQVKKCGREPGGEKAHQMGVCSAATFDKAEGIHGGKNAGRCCWVVAGTFCGGEVQGTFADKIFNCLNCDFYKLIKHEEGKDFLVLKQILKKIK